MDWTRRIDDLKGRLSVLTSLRKLASLDAASDIGEDQWVTIEGQLAAARHRLEELLRRAIDRDLARVSSPAHGSAFNSALGAIEFELAKACTLLDTYLDVLTQRSSQQLGPLLRGCDVLADDALRRDHPALRSLARPLVYCDRGFGASILREGAPLPDGSLNPVALIQIPYSRIQEKHNLTSILHESGHQSIIRLDLKEKLAAAVNGALLAAGAAPELARLYGLWTAELGPDFWAFCLCGAAQTASIRDILSLDSGRVFHWSWNDPHPPPFLRVLISVEWCRVLKKDGPWNRWEREWIALYAPRAPQDDSVLPQALQFRRCAARAFFRARWKEYGNRNLRQMVGKVAPASPCGRLSELRARRDLAADTKRIDESLTDWVLNLGGRRCQLQQIHSMG